MSLSYYQAKFRDLKPNRSGGRASPHKACLLLAVIDLIDAGTYTANIIPFDDRLKDAFSIRFETYKKDGDKDNPANPYFYLSSSGFWHLHPVSGRESELSERLATRKAPGQAEMLRLIRFASLDDGLFKILLDSACRTVLAGELEGTLLTREEAFIQWAISLGKSEKTLKNYLGALRGPLSRWISDYRGTEFDLLDMTGSREVMAVREDLASYEKYCERDRVGKGMYSAAIRLYEKFLAEQDRHAIVDHDIREVLSRDIDGTVKETLVQARRGQGLFRNRLLEQWGGRCAVTGYANPKFLLASHIKPWSIATDYERLDRFNGLPLIPNLDKAFDLGYVSFQSDGRILLSHELELPAILGVRDGQRVALDPRHQAYLEFHRSELFMK